MCQDPFVKACIANASKTHKIDEFCCTNFKENEQSVRSDTFSHSKWAKQCFGCMISHLKSVKGRTDFEVVEKFQRMQSVFEIESRAAHVCICACAWHNRKIWDIFDHLLCCTLFASEITGPAFFILAFWKYKKIKPM